MRTTGNDEQLLPSVNIGPFISRVKSQLSIKINNVKSTPANSNTNSNPGFGTSKLNNESFHVIVKCRFSVSLVWSKKNKKSTVT